MAKPKKQDLIDALIKAGVVLTGEEKIGDLEALVKEHNIVLDVGPEAVTVKWLGNERTYSREIHGEDFQKLAKQFADQHPDAVIA